MEDSVSSGFPSRVSVPCGRTEERGGSEAGSSQIPGLYRVHELRYGYAGRVANALIVGEYFFFFFPFECARANESCGFESVFEMLLQDVIGKRDCFWFRYFYRRVSKYRITFCIEIRSFREIIKYLANSRAIKLVSINLILFHSNVASKTRL